MKEAFEKFSESEEFKEFNKNEEGFIFVHASMIKELGKKSSWEFGFFHQERDRMVIFETDPIKRLPEQEVFKKGPSINPLNLENVSISFEEAMKIVEDVRQEKYKTDPVSKYIIILQNLHKQVWNVTLITTSFNIINIKIDSATGEVISTNKHSIMDLGVRKF